MIQCAIFAGQAVRLRQLYFVNNSNSICRFGEVESIATSDGSLTVQFKERKDAESAKAKGAFYNSGVLLIDWHDGEQI